MACKRTEDGAKEFVRFYFAVVNRGFKDPTHQQLDAFSDKDCIACARMKALIKGFEDKDERLGEDMNTLTALGLATAPTEPTVILNATVKIERVEILDARGKGTGRFIKAETVKRQIGLKWVNDAWVLYGME